MKLYKKVPIVALAAVAVLGGAGTASAAPVDQVPSERNIQFAQYGVTWTHPQEAKRGQSVEFTYVGKKGAGRGALLESTAFEKSVAVEEGLKEGANGPVMGGATVRIANNAKSGTHVVKLVQRGKTVSTTVIKIVN